MALFKMDRATIYGSLMPNTATQGSIRSGHESEVPLRKLNHNVDAIFTRTLHEIIIKYRLLSLSSYLLPSKMNSEFDQNKEQP